MEDVPLLYSSKIRQDFQQVELSREDISYGKKTMNKARGGRGKAGFSLDGCDRYIQAAYNMLGSDVKDN